MVFIPGTNTPIGTEPKWADVALWTEGLQGRRYQAMMDAVNLALGGHQAEAADRLRQLLEEGGIPDERYVKAVITKYLTAQKQGGKFGEFSERILDLLRSFLDRPAAPIHSQPLPEEVGETVPPPY